MHLPLRFWANSLPLVALMCSSGIVAAKSPDSKSPASGIDLFDAMKAGALEVKVFLKDASAGTALIKNVSGKPLTIKLPDAFGAAPVAAQFFGPGPGAPGAGPGGGGNNAGLAGNQNVGGGFPQAGNNNNRGPGPFGPGLFNIEAGKERKLKIVAVCLEHGKEEPNTRLAYELRPINSVTDKPEVVELVRTLAINQADQRAMQAAAWHLANGLSWNELAKMPKFRHLSGITERYFTAKEIERARGYADASKTAAREATSKVAEVASQARTR